jgi:hypothetical protein
MAAPAYDTELINALARVLAEAALNELINEMAADVESPAEPTKTNAATPGQEMCGALRGFDGADHTRTVP